MSRPNIVEDVAPDPLKIAGDYLAEALEGHWAVDATTVPKLGGDSVAVVAIINGTAYRLYMQPIK